MRSLVLAGIRTWLPEERPRTRTLAAGAGLGALLLVVLAMLGGSIQPWPPADRSVTQPGSPQTARQPEPPAPHREQPKPAAQAMPLAAPPREAAQAAPTEPPEDPPAPESGVTVPALPEVTPEVEDVCQAIFSAEDTAPEDAAPQDAAEAREWLRELASRCEEFSTTLPDGTAVTVALSELAESTDPLSALRVLISTELGTLSGWLRLEAGRIAICVPCATPR